MFQPHRRPVDPDMEWHTTCQKCVECGTQLDEMRTCFVREGRTYCKRDYARMFTAKCSPRGGLGFDTKDLVMRARHLVYHVDCFLCAVCSRPLVPGNRFTLLSDGLLCCRQDHKLITNRPDIPCCEIMDSSSPSGVPSANSDNGIVHAVDVTVSRCLNLQI